MKTQRPTVRSWRRWLFMALPPLAAALFALSLALPALAETVVNISRPITFIRTNPCNGETVTFSGDGHLNMHITFDSGGGVHVDLHTTLGDVKGIDDHVTVNADGTVTASFDNFTTACQG